MKLKCIMIFISALVASANLKGVRFIDTIGGNIWKAGDDTSDRRDIRDGEEPTARGWESLLHHMV